MEQWGTREGTRRYLDVPEVREEPLPFLGSHRRVVQRQRHPLRHPLVPELHPTFSVVAPPGAGLLLLPPHLPVCGINAARLGTATRTFYSNNRLSLQRNK